MTDETTKNKGLRAASSPEAAEWEDTRARLAAIVDSSEDAIVSKTLEGIVTSWNAGAERVFGWTAEEMIGQPILKLIPTELQHEEGEILAKLRAGERIERYETVRQHKNGSRLDISLTVSPIRDSRGVVSGAAKIAHDITARRQAERQAQEEARALEMLNRVGRAVAAQLDLERIVQIVTDAATDVSHAAFGAFFYNVTERGKESYWLYALSGAPRAAFANFPMPRATEVFAPTFHGSGAVRSDDIRKDARYGKMAPHFGMPEGHLPVCSYLAAPVVSHTGTVLGGLFFGHPDAGVFTERAERLVVALASQAAIAIDNAKLIQELREREAELSKVAAERAQLLDSERAARTEAERLSRIKDEFLATLSHELRTPLHAIQGWTEILMQSPRSDQDKQALQTIDRNVRAQVRIISDLLDMSRIVAGKLHLEVQPLYLHETVEQALDSVRQSADAKHLRINTLLDSEIGLVRGDANRLQQVFWNLFSNAVKFTPAGGRISVVLERVNSHVEIVVEDTGIGIRSDFLPYVFDRFRQADPALTRRHSGLGLGLSIVKNLVEMHGGSVRVKSPGENQGSTFIVALPVSHVRATDQHPPTTTVDRLDSIELPRLTDVRVLVVDDEGDGRELIARILEDCGARPVCASNAPQALECLSRQDFDVLLSDIGMPDVDGYELIRRVRAREGSARDGRLAAVAITAYARPEDRQRSLLAGYQMHLAKPIEARELIAGIASLLHLSR
ncbi:MAG TPA: ATP-binding protein [Gammaproteobacteria bacterium]|nr:ATP-binding protein [Gammaproteobacteria bacterium]